MAIKLHRVERPEEDFQMAPMIDMVFLLLVFFMCVSTLAQADKSKEVTLPESLESEVAEDLSDRGVVTVDADGQAFLGERSVSAAEIKAELQSSLEQNPRLRVTVRADQETSYKDIKAVLRVCADAGAYEVIYATHQQ
ncbi:ExbD/TolR family protein [Cerasicoccus arenae]|uniref:Biopolymer transporter ExbD n=2 Tax=Cerasicoccus arenae TaxID=424488 RepID=A0A8J3GE05_9BACT|nr:biopolymer transporter ExbD [Cerasicoccus arenae]GHB99391.1 biopolymer transporter ExbD [Cerasicoccus arenae]